MPITAPDTSRCVNTLVLRVSKVTLNPTTCNEKYKVVLWKSGFVRWYVVLFGNLPCPPYCLQLSEEHISAACDLGCSLLRSAAATMAATSAADASAIAASGRGDMPLYAASALRLAACIPAPWLGEQQLGSVMQPLLGLLQVPQVCSPRRPPTFPLEFVWVLAASVFQDGRGDFQVCAHCHPSS